MSPELKRLPEELIEPVMKRGHQAIAEQGSLAATSYVFLWAVIALFTPYHQELPVGLAVSGVLLVAAGLVRVTLVRLMLSGRLPLSALGIWSGVALGAIAWVAFLTSTLLQLGLDAPTSLLVLLMTGGLTAGGVHSLAPNWRGLVLFVVIMLAPALAVAASENRVAVAATLLVFAVFMTVLGYRHNQLYWRSQVDQALLEVKTLQAQAASRAKSEFLANVSHEVRTPLNGILGTAAILADTELSHDQCEQVKTLQESAALLDRILLDLLELAKIEAHQVLLSEDEFVLPELLEDVVSLLGHQARAKQLELVSIIDPTVPERVRGDAGRLRQVVLNLVSNSIKFTESGHVCLKAWWQAGVLTVAVEDTGIGIDPEHFGKIFESFSQVDASSTRQYGGTGLGLSISRRFVEAMGGSIEVESAPGEGSTFTFTVKLTLLEVNATLTVRPTWALVAHPKELSRTSLVTSLRRLGYLTVEAKNLPQANEALGAKKFDLVLWQSELGPAPDGDGLKIALGDSSVSLEGFSAVVTEPVTSRRLRHQLDSSTRQIPQKDHLHLSILVVEDNPVNQKVVVRILENAGHQVHLVGDGHQAVEAALTSDYELVLMDCHIPGMDGFEATRRIREKKAPEALPIVALTAGVSEQDRSLCLEAGMNDHLGKPVRKKELLETIQRLCRNGDR